jgi:glycosidase
MKVVLDTVPNHVGPAHPWASDPPTPDWLHGTPEHHLNVKDDYTSVTDPGAPVARREVFLDGWFADRLPDLNQDNPMVARYLVQNAIWWIESAGLDGLRIDTFAYVPRSFWHGYNEMLHQLYPQLSDVGEIFDGDPHIPSFWAGGRANTGSDGTFDTLLDTPFDFPVYFAIRDVLTHRKAMTALADVLSEDSLYPHPERLVTFLGNHDTKRFLNEKGASPAALRLAFGLIATLRGMPQLYYGEELGMTGGDDPDNRHDFPGGFPNDAVNAFTGANETQAQHEMHDWVQTLLQLRSHTPALQSGSQKTLLADADTFAFVRALPGARDQVLIVLNGDAAAHDVTIPMELLGGDQHYTSLLNGDASVAVTSSTVQVHLPAQQIGIFRAAP